MSSSSNDSLSPFDQRSPSPEDSRPRSPASLRGRALFGQQPMVKPAKLASKTSTSGKLKPIPAPPPPTEKQAPRYHCNYCQQPVAERKRIKCAVCVDFELCPACFAVGVEISGHLTSHCSRLVGEVASPLFSTSAEQRRLQRRLKHWNRRPGYHEMEAELHEPERLDGPDTDGWLAEEELGLLEGVQLAGLNNWAEVAEHVGTSRSAEDCCSHYYKVYLSSPESDATTTDVGKACCPREHPVPSAATLHAQYLEGYNPLRREFPHDYDEVAEEVLYHTTETPREIRLALLRGCRRRIVERTRRTNFAIGYGLERKATKAPKRKRETDRELMSLRRFVAPEDFAQLSDGLSRERALKRKVEELKCRIAGEPALSPTKNGQPAGSTPLGGVKSTSQEKPPQKTLPAASGLGRIENQTCKALRMPPSQFLAFKDAAVRVPQARNFQTRKRRNTSDSEDEPTHKGDTNATKEGGASEQGGSGQEDKAEGEGGNVVTINQPQCWCQSLPPAMTALFAQWFPSYLATSGFPGPERLASA